MKRQKRIGIDARMYGLKHAGIGRYVKNLLEYISEFDNNIQYQVFTHPSQVGKIKLSDGMQLIPASATHYTVKEQWQFLLQVEREKLDLMHFPHFNMPILYHRPFIATIHDILWHQERGAGATTLSPLMYKVKYQAYKLAVNQVVSRSKRLIVPSHWVKTQLTTEFPRLNPRKVRVIYEGVDQDLLESDSNQTKFDLPKSPYVVYVGSAYPHKNLQTLIEAIHLLKLAKRDISLVIVSARNVFLDSVWTIVKQYQLEDKVRLMGFVTDSELREIERKALALIQPSRSEGFGLTGLEAMKLGVPVVAARAGAMPEVYGQAALFFNPNDPKELMQKIITLVDDSKLRQTLIVEGKKQSELYDWRQMAQETQRVYQELLG